MLSKKQKIPQKKHPTANYSKGQGLTQSYTLAYVVYMLTAIGKRYLIIHDVDNDLPPEAMVKPPHLTVHHDKKILQITKETNH